MAEIDLDHDLLVRVDERLRLMQLTLESDRSAVAARNAKQDADFEVYKRDTEARFARSEARISKLETAKAQLVSITAVVTFLISVMVKVFWPSK